MSLSADVDVSGCKSTGVAQNRGGWGLNKPAEGGGGGVRAELWVRQVFPSGAGRTEGQRDVRVGNSQGRTETDQGSIVLIREGVEQLRESQCDGCYFLFGKMLFRNTNMENKAK